MKLFWIMGQGLIGFALTVNLSVAAAAPQETLSSEDLLCAVNLDGIPRLVPAHHTSTRSRWHFWQPTPTRHPRAQEYDLAFKDATGQVRKLPLANSNGTPYLTHRDGELKQPLQLPGGFWILEKFGAYMGAFHRNIVFSPEGQLLGEIAERDEAYPQDFDRVQKIFGTSHRAVIALNRPKNEGGILILDRVQNSGQFVNHALAFETPLIPSRKGLLVAVITPKKKDRKISGSQWWKQELAVFESETGALVRSATFKAEIDRGFGLNQYVMDSGDDYFVIRLRDSSSPRSGALEGAVCGALVGCISGVVPMAAAAVAGVRWGRSPGQPASQILFSPEKELNDAQIIPAGTEFPEPVATVSW